MANKILFPIKEIPSFEMLLDIVVDGFGEFLLPTQQLSIGLSAKKGLDLSDKFIFIQENHHEYSCWISFNYFEPEFRDEVDADYPVMVGIGYRGEMSQKFAVLLTYILAKALNARVIYDDAYLVQRKDDYPVDELKPFVEQYIKELYPADE